MLQIWPLLLPVAAASGWIVGRRRQKQEPNFAKRLSRDYFVGLNYLINEQHDKALDVFLKLFKVSQDTVETHFALGSLFRRRGEVDRAIRIHQNLIARPQLAEPLRMDALLALGRDYLHAGVLDRAEKLFLQVADYNGEQAATAASHLLDIYQQEKAWTDAIAAAKKIQSMTGKSMSKVIAHHYCEQAELAFEQNDLQRVNQHLKKALLHEPSAARAILLHAKLDECSGRYKAAIKAYQRIAEQAPDFLSLAVPSLVRCYQAAKRDNDCIAYLRELLLQYPRVSIVLILADRLYHTHGVDEAIDFVTRQLSQNPSLRGLNQLIQWHIDATYGKVQQKLVVLQEITKKLLQDKPVFRCGRCGFAGKTLHWQCPGCKEWDSVKPIHGLEGD